MKRWTSAIAFFVVAFIICRYYLWAVQVTGDRFYWRAGLNGYYNMLGRAFAKGQLYFEQEPSPELLALPNPWDPATNGPYKLHDVVLFNRHYYLYHGAAPALLIFAPYKLITGYDFPESFAVFLFCFLGFLFFSGALVRVTSLSHAPLSPGWLSIALLAMGASTGTPYLLNRADFYEIAISGGHAFVAAGVFTLIRSINSHHAVVWLTISGLCFGTAIACRPHLGFIGALSLGALVYSRRTLRSREIWAFAAAFALVGCMVALYNYARFGNPFEFGVRYLLAGDVNQQRVRLAPEYLLPGLYFMLLCAPALSRVFPWVEQVFRNPFNSYSWDFPHGYFIEPMIGAIYLAPFAVLPIWLAVRQYGSRDLTWVLRALLGSTSVVILFLSATGFSSQRYQIDFLPLAVFLSLAVFVTQPTIRVWVLPAVCAGIVVNAALAVTGPYDMFQRKRPANYVRLASWFSPIPGHRPLLNPNVDVRINARFATHEAGALEPILFLGHRTHRQLLFVEHLPEKIRLVAENDSARVAADLEHPGERELSIVARAGESTFSVEVDGQLLLRQELPVLVLAPSQIAVGRNDVRYDRMAEAFTGVLRLQSATCVPSSPRGGVDSTTD